MDAKRIGSVLMVGLVLLSAMVVFTGTAAATVRDDIEFYGTINIVYKDKDIDGLLVEIKRTEILPDTKMVYTQTWRGFMDSDGYFKTDRKRYGEGYPNTETNLAGTYELYIDDSMVESKLLGADDFVEHGTVYPDCYLSSEWHRFTYVIPEFSTIAIPIASVLGLLFLFNRRKHRKE